MGSAAFDFYEAFSRNIGFVTNDELYVLRGKRVAIAGLGGVGGSHLLALTRLGIGQFHIADMDKYELANFNRQAGSNVSTIDREKVSVMAEQALLINPELKLKQFREGVTLENINEFLEGVDLYVDGLDLFAFDIRRKIFMECHRRHIPCITVCPVGAGFSLLNFMPGGMTFDEYWKVESYKPIEKIRRFAGALVPSMAFLKSVVQPSAFDFANGRAASTPMGCLFASAVMGTESLKILLKRGKVITAPQSLQFDGYTYKFQNTYLWRGTENPLLKLKLWLAEKLGKV
jgi:molybdopterin/thiamine biosynthesis adenylyltransferase